MMLNRRLCRLLLLLACLLGAVAGDPEASSTTSPPPSNSTSLINATAISTTTVAAVSTNETSTAASYVILPNAKSNRANFSSVMDLNWYTRSTRFTLTTTSASPTAAVRSYLVRANNSTITPMTTTTTTASTSLLRPVSLVKAFRVLAVSLNTSTYAIQIDYQVEMQSLTSYLVLKVEFECSSRDSNQTWYQSVSNQLFTKPLTLTTVSLFSQTRPVHGSLVTCVGRLSDTSKVGSANGNDSASFSHSASLLIDPLPVTNLMFNNINSTCIRLSWFYPQNSFYDSVHIQCHMNDKAYQPVAERRASAVASTTTTTTTLIFSKYIENKFAWRLNKNINLGQQLLAELTPGVFYSCSIGTVRNTSGLFAQATSKTVTMMTELNVAALKPSSKVALANASMFSLEVTPPAGFYDYFQIQLVLSSNGMVIINKNFSYDPTMSSLPILFQDSRQSSLIHAGVSYEFWTQTVRKNPSSSGLGLGGGVNAHQLSFSKRVRLGEAFMIRPDPVVGLFYYVLSGAQIAAYWTAPAVGFYEYFKVSLYTPTAGDQALFAGAVTGNSTVLDVDLAGVDEYKLSVQACSKLNTAAAAAGNGNNSASEMCSEPTNATVATRYELVYGLRVERTESLAVAAVSVKNNNLAVLSFALNASANLCDLGSFHVRYFDLSSLSKYDCFTGPLDTTVFNAGCQNAVAVDRPRLALCKTVSTLNCSVQDTGIGGFRCSFQISQLKPNARFNLSLTAVSQSGLYEWPLSASVLLKTDVALPLVNTRIETNSWLQSQIASPSTINIIEPYVDQSRGAVLEGHLFLVRLGPVREPAELAVDRHNDTANSSSSATGTYSLNVYDQTLLGGLVEGGDACSNETRLLSPCLLRRYAREENDFSRERLLFVGAITPNLRQLYHSFLNYSLTYNLTQFFDCDNVSTSVIEPSNAYQLFFVFKIGDSDSATTRARRRVGGGASPSPLYFATEPSLPIETKSVDYYQMQQNNLVSSRDGLALWIVVVICVFSSLVLISVIIAIVAVIVLRYKPSKFHKAAHVASQPRLNLRSNTGFKTGGTGVGLGLGGGGGYEKDLEFGSSQNDFIEPSEFGRLEMTNIWLIKHANGDLILEEEYRNLPDFRHVKTSYASQAPKNEVKNRFLDIKAYDDSRVVLEVPSSGAGASKKAAEVGLGTGASQTSVDRSIISSMSTSTSSSNSHGGVGGGADEPLGDYINANFIQGFSHERKFIATQGPKRETIVDFWRMISQYRVTAIVMLTKLVEKGVERCTQYWPDKLNITESYGDFEVTLREQQKCGDYIKRTFDLVNTNWTGAGGGSSSTAAMSSRRILTVTQYYYPEWPDKDTPSTDPMSILHLIRDVNANHPSYQYPIVVHCSAGVGRTGTYITLDAMMEKIDTEGKVDIFGFISRIRERRQYLVQTSKQYVFIHEALYEYCLYGFTAIEVNGALASHVRQMKELSTVNAQGVAYQPGAAAKTRLQVEFEKLSNAFAPNSQAREAFSADNKARNRNLNTICYDDNRIKLSTLNGASYINATKIKGYELSNELIVTQDPMENTVFEFLKMITEFDCHIVVALNKEFELEKSSVYWPTAADPVRVFEADDLKFVIEHVRPDDDDLADEPGSHITKSFFEITEYKHSSSTKMDIVLFMYNEFWLENTVPKSRKNLLDLVAQVQKETINFDQTRIVVHGHGGGSNCSVFCALSILSEQFKNDQYVDVCRTVKKLKTQRPHMIETYEQYEFLYNCLTSFAEIYGMVGRTTDSFYGRPVSESNDSSVAVKKSPSKQASGDLASPNYVELSLR